MLVTLDQMLHNVFLPPPLRLLQLRPGSSLEINKHTASDTCCIELSRSSLSRPTSAENLAFSERLFSLEFIQFVGVFDVGASAKVIKESKQPTGPAKTNGLPVRATRTRAKATIDS